MSFSPLIKIKRFFQQNLLILSLWLFFRMFTSVVAAISSTIKPMTDIERRISIWPPAPPVSEWLERTFISPWARWDVSWYTRIITNGYSKGDGTANFHPLYPWLGKLLTNLISNPTFSLLIISTISSLLLLLIFKKLLAFASGNEETSLSLMILLLFPTSFVLFAPYPESLFLLFSILCMYFLRKRKWAFAGYSAFFAVLTRQQGLFLIFPYIWELWHASDGNIPSISTTLRNWLTVLFIPLAYLLWIGYRIFYLREINIKTSTIQEIIYSIFISPSAKEVVPNQSFLWPWKTIFNGFNKIINSPDLDIWINMSLAIIFILLFIIAWKNMTASSRLYSAIIYFVSFSYFTGLIHPLMGLPRHLSLAFPIFAGISPSLAKSKPMMWLYIFICIVLMVMLITAYILMAWVP